jgi:hypothetical protein
MEREDLLLDEVVSDGAYLYVYAMCLPARISCNIPLDLHPKGALFSSWERGALALRSRICC